MTRRRSNLAAILAAAVLASVGLALLGGCAVVKLFGGMAQNYEYQKRIEVLPQYSGLEDQTVAVIVEADLSTLYEHPDTVAKIAGGVVGRLRRDVPNVRVVDPGVVINWQYRTPQWNALPYGQIAEQLGVNRLVHIDLYEYRFHPPGNRWEWEGACSANVGVVERDGFDPDTFVEVFAVESRFPTIKGVGLANATQSQIELGLLAEFIRKTAWLFHTHLEPKYPDKYRPIRE